MRVLYVIDSLAPGGAEMSLAALAPHLIKGGVDLDVAYFHDRPGVHQQLLDAGARLTLLGECGGRRGRVGAVRRLVDATRPDLVHTTLFEADIAGRIASRLARTPVVSSLVMDSYGDGHRNDHEGLGWRLRAAQGVDIATAQLVRRFHANSEAVASTMSRRLVVSRRRMDVVHRGRDAAALGQRTSQRRTKTRESLGLPDANTRLVLAVGRHEPAKGFDVLLSEARAIRDAVPSAVIAIAGRPGNATAELEKIVESTDSGGFVRLLGHRSDVADLMCAADLLVAPSRREGLPGTLIEALAMECPIVAADIPTIREVASFCAVALVKPDDAPLLAIAVADALQDLNRLDSLAKQGRTRFLENFTIERSAAGMLAFYSNAMRT